MTISMNEQAVDQFFRDARERHAIYLRRAAGAPRSWTQDPVMQKYRITNVFRELDRTTTWLRDNVRGPLADESLVLPAVALARWFNYIPSMETLFKQPSLFGGTVGPAGTVQPRPDPVYPAAGQPSPAAPAGSAAGLLPGSAQYPTPWQEWMSTENLAALEWPLRKQGAPWVTGAYMIRTPIGMDKLEGVLSSFRNLWTRKPKFKTFEVSYLSMDWREVAGYCLAMRNTSTPVALETVWEWLKNFYGLGPFMAYEIVTDLRHTKLLDRAPDVDTWANPGPGALRGAALLLRDPNRVRKGRLEKSSVAEAKAVMDELLRRSRDERYWPQRVEDGKGSWGVTFDATLYDGQLSPALLGFDGVDWPRWELHEVEMWLCETAKLVRTRLGWGRPRGNFEGF